jgi:hypothetical protein
MSCSTDDNAFGDDSEQQQQQPQHEAPLDDDFGLSSPPPAGAAASSGGADVDPFATVDGGSTSNAGAFDSFTNNPAEAKEEQQEALASVDNHNRFNLFHLRMSSGSSRRSSGCSSAICGPEHIPAMAAGSSLFG